MNVRVGFGLSGAAVVAVVAGGLAWGQTAAYPPQDQGQYGQQQSPQQDPQQQGPVQDPPDRVARLAYLQGEVSMQPASPHGDAPFVGAEVNFTLGAGDRLYTGQDGLTEVETDNLALRMGRLADMTIQNMAPDYVQLGLAQGSLRVRSYALEGNGGVEVDTANGAFTVLQAGDVRVASYPGFGQRPDTTIVTVSSGEVHAVGNGVDTVVQAGQVLRMDGTNPAQMQFVQALAADELDQFDEQRDAERAQAAGEVQNQYVSQEMVGYDDLAAYGDWSPQPEYGAVWYPRGVDGGWSPYSNGHWAYVAPWGQTWVEAEPWGFAPFHYGRWAQFDGRWGWVPGPVVVRPVYSPALVAFAGGGVSVTAWFPLGPLEPFVPWYRTSPGYVNRVNVSNIYNRNVVEVRNVYGNRTSNIYVTNNVTYVNRGATVAVSRAAYAAGQPVRGAQVRFDGRQAQVMTRPPEIAVRAQGAGPARVVPAVQARPQFERGAQGNGAGQRFGQAPQPVVRQGFGGGQQQPQGQQGRGQSQAAPGNASRPVQTPAPAVQGQPSRPSVQGQPIQNPQVPVARPPGAMRPQGFGNNPDLRPDRVVQQPGQQPVQRQEQQFGQRPDASAPVGGGRNMRPAEPMATPGTRPAPQQAAPQGAGRPQPQMQRPAGPPPAPRAKTPPPPPPAKK